MSEPPEANIAKFPFKPCNFIPDGWDRTDTIPGSEDGFYGPMTITYRPMTDLERETMAARIRHNGTTEAGVVKSASVVNQAIAGKLVAWDVRHPDTGVEVPITPENVGRLEPHLLAVLLATITGERRHAEEVAAEKN